MPAPRRPGAVQRANPAFQPRMGRKNGIQRGVENSVNCQRNPTITDRWVHDLLGDRISFPPETNHQVLICKKSKKTCGRDNRAPGAKTGIGIILAIHSKFSPKSPATVNQTKPRKNVLARDSGFFPHFLKKGATPVQKLAQTPLHMARAPTGGTVSFLGPDGENRSKGLSAPRQRGANSASTDLGKTKFRAPHPPRALRFYEGSAGSSIHRGGASTAGPANLQQCRTPGGPARAHPQKGAKEARLHADEGSGQMDFRGLEGRRRRADRSTG